MDDLIIIEKMKMKSNDPKESINEIPMKELGELANCKPFHTN